MLLTLNTQLAQHAELRMAFMETAFEEAKTTKGDTINSLDSLPFIRCYTTFTIALLGLQFFYSLRPDLAPDYLPITSRWNQLQTRFAQYKSGLPPDFVKTFSKCLQYVNTSMKTHAFYFFYDNQSAELLFYNERPILEVLEESVDFHKPTIFPLFPETLKTSGSGINSESVPFVQEAPGVLFVPKPERAGEPDESRQPEAVPEEVLPPPSTEAPLQVVKPRTNETGQPTGKHPTGCLPSWAALYQEALTEATLPTFFSCKHFIDQLTGNKKAFANSSGADRIGYYLLSLASANIPLHHYLPESRFSLLHIVCGLSNTNLTQLEADLHWLFQTLNPVLLLQKQAPAQETIDIQALIAYLQQLPASFRMPEYIVRLDLYWQAHYSNYHQLNQDTMKIPIKHQALITGCSIKTANRFFERKADESLPDTAQKYMAGLTRVN